MRSVLVIGLALLLAACGEGPESQKADEGLVVYTARKEHLIKPLFDRFTAQTGIPIRYVTDAAGPLLARLQAEGERSRADLLITVDAGNLWQAAEAGVLQPIESDVLASNIPSALRDEGNRWFGLSIRARTIIYSTERVKPSELSTYEALADEQWTGRLCLRTAKKVYNQSLVATMIAARGEAETEEIVSGWVKNLAVPPFSNDNKVVEAIAAGQCDVGIVNTYYLARMVADDPSLPVTMFWPNQQGEGADGRGVHLNISGAGITRASQHVAEAQQLIEWLSGTDAQLQLALLNQEYPVNPQVSLPEPLTRWGEFEGDDIPVAEAGRLQGEAIRVMDRAGYR
ncbi:iron(III) transport system substrate-binding protein [Litorivivens lipolytica]|uniref:Iron(III) transport system substrate-binding protein n=2 Tax=Litorivivens lipolytica TaxID=1524264 RepID=A0A7W4W6T2_9GAMM|nr:extracellular solute-binding protein [Litorivivens lipolytica]MBB3048390.1 iron(III) transport system substrate-binding protein [Litorivivens lipolytica]